jgi:hypothetical protein
MEPSEIAPVTRIVCKERNSFDFSNFIMYVRTVYVENPLGSDRL